MKMTKEHRAKTGAFYTPKIWADMAVKYLQEVLGDLTKYTFYDPCAGEGALLEALPDGCRRVASTLEAEDVEILRKKGIMAWQFDMLKGDEADLPKEFINSLTGEVVIFTNPPYMKLKGEEWTDCHAKRYYGEWAKNDATALILLRCIYEVPHVCIATFSKLDILQGGELSVVRLHLPKLQKAFISPSMSWGLSGKFPILFSVFCEDGWRN